MITHPELGLLALEVKGGRVAFDPANEALDPDRRIQGRTSWTRTRSIRRRARCTRSSASSRASRAGSGGSRAIGFGARVPRRPVRDRGASGRARRDRDRSERPRPARRTRPARSWGPGRVRGDAFGAEGMEAVAMALGFRVEIRTPLKLRFDEEDKKIVELTDGSGVGARVRAPSAPRGRDRSGGQRQDPARHLRREAARRRPGIGRCSRASTAGSAIISASPSARPRGSTSRRSTSSVSGWRRKPGSSCRRRRPGPAPRTSSRPAPRGARRGGARLGPAVRRDRGGRGTGLPRVVVARAALAPDRSRRRAPVRVRRRQPEPLRGSACRSARRTGLDRSPATCGTRKRSASSSRSSTGRAGTVARGPRGRARRDPRLRRARRISSTCSRWCCGTWSRTSRSRSRTSSVLDARRAGQEPPPERGGGRRLPPVRDRRAGHRPRDQRPRVQGPRAAGGDPRRARREAPRGPPPVPVRRRLEGEEPPRRPRRRTCRARAPKPITGVTGP